MGATMAVRGQRPQTLGRQLRRAGAFALGIALAGFGSARASTVLPDAFASGFINMQQVSFCGPACTVRPELSDFGSVTGLGSGATATVSASRSPFTVSASFDAEPGWTAAANTAAQYSFEWIGPTSATPINTDIDLLVHTAIGAGASQALADFDIFSEATNAIISSNRWSCAFNGCSDPDFSGTVNLSLMPNVIYDVQMDVRLTILSPTPNAHFGGGQAQASIDPHIFQDPNASNPLFSLLLSPNVGNTVGVPGAPEPSVWAMLAIGFGLIGSLARRRVWSSTGA